MDLNKVTKAFINIREARRELKAKFDQEDGELEATQKQIEVTMLRYLDEHKVERMGTDAGTFFRQVDVKPAAADWSAIYKWIVENNAWELLEKRLKKTFVAQFMETHEGMLPPGINVHREYVVRVRKPQ